MLALNWRALGLGLLFFNSTSNWFVFNTSRIRAPRALILVLKHLTNEFTLPISGKQIPFTIFVFILSFIFVRSINFIGLTPYTFTPSRSISVTLRLALIVWLFIEVGYFLSALSRFLSHLVPAGTPNMLIPLIVLIELVRNFIRPITLSVRLAANMVAGHLLIRLINGGDLSFHRVVFIVVGGLILFFLEISVAFIQGYVFRTLRVMYISELNENLRV